MLANYGMFVLLHDYMLYLTRSQLTPIYSETLADIYRATMLLKYLQLQLYVSHISLVVTYNFFVIMIVFRLITFFI